jgi:hypothetical protein
VVVGFVTLALGLFLVGTAVLGDVFVKGRVVNEYADPRVPVELEPGSYPVEWFGPAKGSFPFRSDLDIKVKARLGQATWRPGGSQAVIPTGDFYDDMAKMALGSLDVRERAVVSMRFNPSVPTNGAPRIRVHQTKYPPVRTRGTELLVVGVILFALGCAGVGWGRSGTTRSLMSSGGPHGRG